MNGIRDVRHPPISLIVRRPRFGGWYIYTKSLRSLYEQRRASHPDRGWRCAQPAGVAGALGENGDQVDAAGAARESLAAFRRARHDVVITELALPGPEGGMEIVEQVKAERPETLVLVEHFLREALERHHRGAKRLAGGRCGCCAIVRGRGTCGSCATAWSGWR